MFRSFPRSSKLLLSLCILIHVYSKKTLDTIRTLSLKTSGKFVRQDKGMF